MAQNQNPGKKVAKLLEQTKKMAGDRKVTISDKPQAGMPGSGKMAELKEVVITAAPIKKAEEPKASVGLKVSVANAGNQGSLPYAMEDIYKLAKENRIGGVVNAIDNARKTGVMNTIKGDDADILRSLIAKKKIAQYNPTKRTMAEAVSIFKSGKSN